MLSGFIITFQQGLPIFTSLITISSLNFTCSFFHFSLSLQQVCPFHYALNPAEASHWLSQYAYHSSFVPT